MAMQNISAGPSAHNCTSTRGKKVIFLPFLTHLGYFGGLPELKEKMNKTKKLHLVLEDMVIFLFHDFYS